MPILTKAEIIGLIGGVYPVLTADDCADLRETFDALYAALEAWQEWANIDYLDNTEAEENAAYAKAVELTKAVGVSWEVSDAETV